MQPLVRDSDSDREHIGWRPSDSFRYQSRQAAYDFGRAVRFWRREVMGWSLRELGERVGCHAQNVSAVESNRSHPQLASLARYARAFGIPIRLLVLTAEAFGQELPSQP